MNKTLLEQFSRDGYVIIRGFATDTEVQTLKQEAMRQLELQLAPVEYEADVGYPGAPISRDVDGGRTIRRLRSAYARGDCFRDWATKPALTGMVSELLNSSELVLSQAHHNCIMTKQSGFSSETNWHQDIRYWAFDRPELVNAWLALGFERRDNGGLLVLPGSHRWELDYSRFDEAKFLLKDLPENQPLIDSAVAAELEPGDLLLFHCRTFHAASRNHTDQTKYSLVFTYHGPDVHPEPGTRSAHDPEIRVRP